MVLSSYNSEIDQDRVFDTTDHFKRFGYIMFPEQVVIYRNIAQQIQGQRVLEAGCGNGVGTAMLEKEATSIIGTDKLEENVKFAKCLYPWINFRVWDINTGVSPTDNHVNSVVCVETIEHVEYPQLAIQHLINATKETVWVSTPNGSDKPRPPENLYHVCEYTPEEMLAMLTEVRQTVEVEILHWKDFTKLEIDTDVDPLVYKVQKVKK